MSDIVSGVQWASAQAALKNAAAREEFVKTGQITHKGSVVNMSLGGANSRALDDAVNKAAEGGVHFAVAAGNDDDDACKYSPAAAEYAITVGAFDFGDARAWFSNWGQCVDVFAPGTFACQCPSFKSSPCPLGVSITSTSNGNSTSTAVLSGTSMASPHVAGLIAYLLSIYPSPSFNPVFDKEDNLISLTNDRWLTKTSSIYSVAHAVLPQWIVGFLPSPKLVEASLLPIPTPPTLTPLQMKKALIALATDGMLSDLPADTINKIVFNNVTYP
jgi:cerevisin